MKNTARTIIPFLALIAVQGHTIVAPANPISSRTAAPFPQEAAAPTLEREAPTIPPTPAALAPSQRADIPMIPVPEPASEGYLPADGGLIVVGGMDEQLSSLEWAADHFTDAGLTLPPLVVEFHANDDGCDGYDGTYRPDDGRLDVCNPHRLIILHELAHAWEHHTLTDEQRREFISFRGLTSWNDLSTPWKERGIEDLAEIVVWGLQQTAGTSRVDRRPERANAFSLVTGIEISTDEAPVSRASALPDPSDGDLDWDTWE